MKQLLLFLACTSIYAGTFSGKIVGVFDNFVWAGSLIDLNGNYVPKDNNATGPASLVGGGTNSIQWGTNIPLAVPIYSSLVFAGNTFNNQPGNQTFDLGTITFLNGTSTLDSLLFGCRLTLTALDFANQPIASITQSINPFDVFTTVNTGISPERDADLIFFKNIAVSFNVAEGATSTATVRGAIVGDPNLILSGLANPTTGGTIGIGPSAFTPEPASWATALAGLVALAGIAKRKKVQA